MEAPVTFRPRHQGGDDDQTRPLVQVVRATQNSYRAADLKLVVVVPTPVGGFRLRWLDIVASDLPRAVPHLYDLDPTILAGSGSSGNPYHVVDQDHGSLQDAQAAALQHPGVKPDQWGDEEDLSSFVNQRGFADLLKPRRGELPGAVTSVVPLAAGLAIAAGVIYAGYRLNVWVGLNEPETKGTPLDQAFTVVVFVLGVVLGIVSGRWTGRLVGGPTASWPVDRTTERKEGGSTPTETAVSPGVVPPLAYMEVEERSTRLAEALERRDLGLLGVRRRRQRLAIASAAMGVVLLLATLGVATRFAVDEIISVPGDFRYWGTSNDVVTEFKLAAIGCVACLVTLLIAWLRAPLPNGYDRRVPPIRFILAGAGVPVGVWWLVSDIHADFLALPSWWRALVWAVSGGVVGWTVAIWLGGRGDQVGSEAGRSRHHEDRIVVKQRRRQRTAIALAAGGCILLLSLVWVVTRAAYDHVGSPLSDLESLNGFYFRLGAVGCGVCLLILLRAWLRAPQPGYRDKPPFGAVAGAAVGGAVMGALAAFEGDLGRGPWWWPVAYLSLGTAGWVLAVGTLDEDDQADSTEPDGHAETDTVPAAPTDSPRPAPSDS